MGTRLFVGNLSAETTEDDLRGAFTQGGFDVRDVKVVTERETGRPRGFGFVELASETAARDAKDQLDGHDLKGRPLNVREARERTGLGDRPGR